MDRQEDLQPPEPPPGGNQKPELAPKKSFWTTLPGVLTAIASVIVAIGGLIAALNTAGLIHPPATPTATTTLTPTPTQTFIPTPTSTSTPLPTETPTPTITLTPSPTDTPTPSHPPGPYQTPTPQPPPTQVIVAQLEFCMRKMSESAVVRKGPDLSTLVLGNVASEACLLFDSRLPDNSWVRIAKGQPFPYRGMAGGWIRSENLNELADIRHLGAYIPKDAMNGLYCVSAYTGIKVRACADVSCPFVRSLGRGECLIYDGRLADSSWLRIASGQAGYLDLAEQWAASVNLVVKEFLGFVDPHPMLPYFELLQEVSPPPTPAG